MIELNEEQIAHVEAPHKRRMWGHEEDCQSVFIRQSFGNGDKLVGITPMNTRPHYYVIRIDSKWNADTIRDGDAWLDHLDEDIYEAIIEQCGSAEDSRSDWKEADRPCPEKEPWPALDLDCGTSWFDYSFPMGFGAVISSGS